MSEIENVETAVEVAEPPACPPGMPEKFWDSEGGAVRVDALAKSYRELERKLSGMIPAPSAEMEDADRQRLWRALGVPEAADGYEVAVKDGLFEPDAEVNAALHQAGFTPAQAQLVYDLAADRLAPLVQEIAADARADSEIERLEAQFGGPEKWRETSRQLLAWGRENLPAEALEGLAASVEGVQALHRMMSSAEPPAVRADAGSGETDLQTLMRDPRYWRDKDPAIVARVTEGFRKLYPA